MVDITLTYRLFKDVAENSPEFVAEVNTQDLILDLQEKIYEEVKKLNNDFLEIEANDLKLWKVEINNGDNDKFSSLVLPNDDVKNLNKLKEKIVDHWDDEEKRPKEGCTHVIVDSPILTKNKELVKRSQINQDLMDQINTLTLNQGFPYFLCGLANIYLLLFSARWAENTRLQLAFSNGTIHEGDIVKYRYKDDNITTLRAAEGWAYINHENTFHPTVSSFVKKFLKLSNAPGSGQLKQVSIGNVFHDDMPERRRRRNNNRV
ncbi:hypothetical protein RhiirA4_521233 [Rhizophagus irregularis]|uniref:Crinkler effector protein N-terminal domain-containing protein n=1 Tax=Rhizophagus irregularis TaxID=588596 RepID=A0A2I1FT52_9GLOM|nr:hypothetical protein RhiirA4_521233 [Rhizophagus irregularis]